MKIVIANVNRRNVYFATFHRFLQFSTLKSLGKIATSIKYN